MYEDYYGKCAYNPSPQDGADHVRPDTWLCFQAPAEALCMDPNADPNLKGPFKYDVYFGTDPCALLQIQDDYTPVECNDVMCFDPCAANLAEGTVYCWRVDINDLNDLGGGGDPCFYEGRVFRFRTWGFADEPNPADARQQVSPRIVLSWTGDGYAVSFDVYFGTSFAEVNDANTTAPEFKTNQSLSDVNYVPGLLELNTTHYWRIDEVNTGTIKGSVWTFTTANYLIVDDFDSYANDSELWAVWDDYWVNGTGSEVFVETDPNFTRDGDGNSIMFKYDGSYKISGEYVGSVMDADIVDLEIGPDWTISDARSLVLYFYGQSGNAANNPDVMWLELEDTSSNSGYVIYDKDPNDVKLEEWNEWNIDLAIFDACGVSMANVDKVHVGFGSLAKTGVKAAGGTGTVWFDDIRLYPTRCRPELVAMDLTGDCVTDYKELRIMARDWLADMFFGLEHTALGQVQLSFDSNGLVVSNIGSTGEDGVEVALPDNVILWQADIIDLGDPNDPNNPIPDGASGAWAKFFDSKLLSQWAACPHRAEYQPG
jgi:hypothetical protein